MNGNHNTTTMTNANASTIDAIGSTNLQDDSLRGQPPAAGGRAGGGSSPMVTCPQTQ